MSTAVERSRATLLGHVTEKRFQAEVIRRAHLHGWLVHHSRPAAGRDGRWNTPIEGDAGYVDLTLARAGRLLFLELKSLAGRTTPAQRTWLSELAKVLGAEVHVVSPADWPLIDMLLA